jgi:hypothetical protein
MGWRLGPFHRQILDALEASRNGPLPDDSIFLKTAGRSPGWAKIKDVEVLLDDGVYDLVAVARCVLKLAQPPLTGVPAGFRAAFSRAVRELVRAGRLQELSVVPIVKSNPRRHHRIKRLEEGTFADCSDLPVRFVRRRDPLANRPQPGVGAPRS